MEQGRDGGRGRLTAADSSLRSSCEAVCFHHNAHSPSCQTGSPKNLHVVCMLVARACVYCFFLTTLCNPVCCHDVEVWVHIRQKCLKVEFRHFDSNSSTWMCVCELSSPQVCFCAGMSASRGVWRQEAVSATAGVLCRSCLTHS